VGWRRILFVEKWGWCPSVPYPPLHADTTERVSLRMCVRRACCACCDSTWQPAAGGNYSISAVVIYTRCPRLPRDVTGMQLDRQTISRWIA